METQTLENKCMDTKEGRELEWTGSLGLTYAIDTVYKIDG